MLGDVVGPELETVDASVDEPVAVVSGPVAEVSGPVAGVSLESSGIETWPASVIVSRSQVEIELWAGVQCESWFGMEHG